MAQKYSLTRRASLPGIANYETYDELPLNNVTVGRLAWVSQSQKLYLYDGAWQTIDTTNISPEIYALPTSLSIPVAVEYTLDLDTVARDPDGLNLTYSVTTPTPPTDTDTIVEIDTQGNLVIIPGLQPESFIIEITADDGIEQASKLMTVTTINTAPQITPIATQFPVYNPTGLYTVPLAFTDIDLNDSVTWSIVSTSGIDIGQCSISPENDALLVVVNVLDPFTVTVQAAQYTATPSINIEFTVITDLPQGQIEFGHGTSTWTVPQGVTEISAVTVGNGGGAYGDVNSFTFPSVVRAGGGGALSYSTSVSVTPGETLDIINNTTGYGIYRDGTPLLYAESGGDSPTTLDNSPGGRGGRSSQGIGEVTYSGGDGFYFYRNGNTRVVDDAGASGGTPAGYDGDGFGYGNAGTDGAGRGSDYLPSIGSGAGLENFQYDLNPGPGGIGIKGLEGQSFTPATLSTAGGAGYFYKGGAGGEDGNLYIGGQVPTSGRFVSNSRGVYGGFYGAGGGISNRNNTVGLNSQSIASGRHGRTRIIWGANRAYPGTRTADKPSSPIFTSPVINEVIYPGETKTFQIDTDHLDGLSVSYAAYVYEGPITVNDFSIDESTGELTLTSPANNDDTPYKIIVVATSTNNASVGQVATFSPVVPAGQEEYTSAGSYSLTVPEGVYSLSAVAVGGGGGGGGSGGGGGGLGWGNILVSPGDTISIVVGDGGLSRLQFRAGIQDQRAPTAGGDSIISLDGTPIIAGYGGTPGQSGQDFYTNPGGSFLAPTGGGGGDGGGTTLSFSTPGPGGGGAGGYTGNGGTSRGSGFNKDGAGGGGGAGYLATNTPGQTESGGGGGGTGIYGQGASGLGSTGFRIAAQGGSGGNDGGIGTFDDPGGFGGAGGFPGGGGGSSRRDGGSGAGGAVRILWGSNRSYPTTNVGLDVGIKITSNQTFSAVQGTTLSVSVTVDNPGEEPITLTAEPLTNRITNADITVTGLDIDVDLPFDNDTTDHAIRLVVETPLGYRDYQDIIITPNVPVGQDLFETDGTFTVPAGVNQISVVAIGSGGAAAYNSTFASGGGGGMLTYTNNISVSPGDTFSVTVNDDFGDSKFIRDSDLSTIALAYGGDNASRVSTRAVDTTDYDEEGGNGGGTGRGPTVGDVSYQGGSGSTQRFNSPGSNLSPRYYIPGGGAGSYTAAGTFHAGSPNTNPAILNGSPSSGGKTVDVYVATGGGGIGASGTSIVELASNAPGDRSIYGGTEPVGIFPGKYGGGAGIIWEGKGLVTQDPPDANNYFSGEYYNGLINDSSYITQKKPDNGCVRVVYGPNRNFPNNAQDVFGALDYLNYANSPVQAANSTHSYPAVGINGDFIFRKAGSYLVVFRRNEEIYTHWKSISVPGDIESLGFAVADDVVAYSQFSASAGTVEIATIDFTNEDLDLTQTTTLTNSSTTNKGTRFGYRISYDGEWLAISDPTATVSGENQAGVVHLYQRGLNPNNWTYITDITSPDNIANAHFGASMTLNNDWLIVGNFSGDNYTNPNNGKVYVYQRTGTLTWGLFLELSNLAPLGYDSTRFGHMASDIWADVWSADPTVFTNIFTGATTWGKDDVQWFAVPAGFKQNKIYMFKWTNGVGLAYHSTIENTNILNGYQTFGMNIAGNNDIMVTSDFNHNNEKTTNPYGGYISIYKLINDVWTLVHRVSPNLNSYDGFGGRIDINGNTIVVTNSRNWGGTTDPIIGIYRIE